MSVAANCGGDTPAKTSTLGLCSEALFSPRPTANPVMTVERGGGGRTVSPSSLSWLYGDFVLGGN